MKPYTLIDGGGPPNRLYFTMVVLFFLAASFLIGGLALERLIYFIGSLPDNPISSKLVSYYERREPLDVTYYGFSNLFFLLIFSVLISSKRHYLRYQELLQFQIYILVGIMAFLSFNEFPVFSHRIVSMIVTPAFFLLAATLSILSRRFGVLLVFVYAYASLRYIQNTIAIGPYHL